MTSHVLRRESGARTGRPRPAACAATRSAIRRPVPPAPCNATTSGTGPAGSAAGTTSTPSRPVPRPSGCVPAAGASPCGAPGRADSRAELMAGAYPGAALLIPAQLVQPGVVDAEVVRDLVDDRHPDLLDDLLDAVAHGHGG